MSEEVIKECPFCGRGPDCSDGSVWCDECGNGFTQADEGIHGKRVIDLWNTRFNSPSGLDYQPNPNVKIMVDTKKCPFCGRRPLFVPSSDGPSVSCYNCDWHFWCADEKEAKQKWETRTVVEHNHCEQIK